MLVVLSPAKTIDFSIALQTTECSTPVFEQEAFKLVKELRKLKLDDLTDLMGISPKLAELNRQRYADWTKVSVPENSRPALGAFKGDVYEGLRAWELPESDLLYTQAHLRILSGLYGVLRPLDSMQAYRLEMGTKWKTEKYTGLYDFWGDRISRSLQQAMKDSGAEVLVNLASNEYFKSVKTDKLKTRVLTPVFKEQRDDGYKVISFSAKKARGMMTRFIMKNRIENPEDLKFFSDDNYLYNEALSAENEWVFTR